MKKSYHVVQNPQIATMALAKLGTYVPSCGRSQVERFNELNTTIAAHIHELARAYSTLAEHVPLLREMQALLSQRPQSRAGFNFQMGKGRVRAVPVVRLDQLPTWSQWVRAYGSAIGYSVRHIRRVILDEPRQKFVKECGWSRRDHNHLLRAATLAFDLVNALEAGADTVALVSEVRQIFGSVQSILDRPYEPEKIAGRKRPARHVTE